MRGLRWLSVVAPVVAVAIIELVSDGLLDAMFPFPLDTVVVVGIVAILAWVFSTVAFRRIDLLSEELRTRNADLERREASARALHRVSVAIAALDDLDEILAAIVDQAREQLGADVAVLITYGPDGEAYVAAVERARPTASTAAADSPCLGCRAGSSDPTSRPPDSTPRSSEPARPSGC